MGLSPIPISLADSPYDFAGVLGVGAIRLYRVHEGALAKSVAERQGEASTMIELLAVRVP